MSSLSLRPRSGATHPHDPPGGAAGCCPVIVHHLVDVVRHEPGKQPANHRPPLLYSAVQCQVRTPLPQCECNRPERAHQRTQAKHWVRVQREGHQRSPPEHLESERVQQDIWGWSVRMSLLEAICPKFVIIYVSITWPVSWPKLWQTVTNGCQMVSYILCKKKSKVSFC